ncbi:hypothetical protein VNO77_20039 [Canavalia gladiata]|uniref:Uncharacterized protein n=1 Tax=Canavalia gladiata TaxID=3824 RepID=A0AAN9LNX1_CANGL
MCMTFTDSSKISNTLTSWEEPTQYLALERHVQEQPRATAPIAHWLLDSLVQVMYAYFMGNAECYDQAEALSSLVDTFPCSRATMGSSFRPPHTT